MKFGWIEIILIVLASVVVTLIGVWAWTEFQSWRINREYGPGNRRRQRSGRRRDD